MIQCLEEETISNVARSHTRGSEVTCSTHEDCGVLVNTVCALCER